MKTPKSKEFAELNEIHLELHDEGGFLGINTDVFAEKLAEFALLHVKEALKQASENFKMKQKDDIHELDMNDDWMEVDKDSILNAYPIENIK